MSNALQELESFTRFAQEKLSTAGSSWSLEECVRQWREQTQRQEALADIQQGQADYSAALGQPIAEAFDEVRRQLGLVR